MPRLRRLPFALGLVLAVGGAGALAEEPGPSTVEGIREHLRSAVPADVAWGAWSAARRGLGEVGGEIARGLRQERPEAVDLKAWSCRQRVLLDAAIRLQVPLDDAALAGHELEAVVVYLVEGPRQDDAQALRVFRQRDTGEGETHVAWAALGNHLCTRGAPGFAAYLLPRLSLRVELSVYSTDDTGNPSTSSPPPATVPGCGVMRIPPGFPPVAVHSLSFEPRTASRLLAGGTVPVFVNRWLERESIGFASSLVRGPPRDRLVACWLQDWGVYHPLLAKYRDVGWSWRLDWTGTRPWVRALQPAIDTLHDAFWALVRSLVRKGLLTADEAVAVVPPIVLEVHDHRRDTRRPLPPVPAPTRGNPWTVRPAPRPGRPV